MRSTGVDITEESKQRELLTKCGLKHLKDGEAEGSLRSVLSVEEGSVDYDGNEYHLGEGAVALGSYTRASGRYANAEGVGAKAFGDYAHAEGLNTTASGTQSHAEGANTTASGSSSHAEGDRSTASGFSSHAEGNSATASGDNSHAEGISTVASGSGSHAEGNMSKAIGVASHAAGVGTTAQGDYSHAEGNTTTAIGEAAHTEGRGTTASGDYSHAEGQETIVQEEAIGSHAEGYQTVVHGEVTHEDGTTTKGDYAHAEGENTQAYGRGSHAEGLGTQAKAQGSHAEGNGTIANGQWSHAAGTGTTANGMFSHAEGMMSVTENAAMASHVEGYQCVTKNNFAHAEGNVNIAEGFASHAEGGFNIAKGQYSHAEGTSNFANAQYSHAEGTGNTIAENAYYGHAEGNGNTVNGLGAHAEGYDNTVNGQRSHAEGMNNIVDGLAAHAEGSRNTASGESSHAEGTGSIASGDSSHAGGFGTIASHESQTAIGKYNKDVDSLFSVGNGEYDEAALEPVRKDAFRVERDGKIYILDEEGNEVLLQGLVLEDKAESVFVSGGDKKYGVFLSILLDDIDGDTSEEVVADFERHFGESILLYVTSTTTSSADSGNLTNQGSYALVNLKFSPMENGTYAWIPEMLVRNGMRNGDVRVSGGDVSEYAVGFGSSVEGSVMTVRLIANNTSNCTLIWRTGEAVPIADKSSFYYKSITTGYVHAAKWAKEDCCLEADSHLLASEEFHECGFSAAENEDDWGNLDYLYLFPENQSKYTAYQIWSYGGCPVDDLTDFRVTVSKISASNRPSGNRITNGLVYEVEQEVVGLVAGEEVKFTRTGSVDLTNGNFCTWRPWKRFVLVGLDEVADDGVLALTQENLNDYYDADTEILQVPAGTKTILFNLPDTKVAAIQMEGVTSGQRITVAGSFVPSQHYSADKNVDGRFSSYLYTYRSGYNMGSHDGRLEYAFEDFMYYYGVWYSKGY